MTRKRTFLLTTTVVTAFASYAVMSDRPDRSVYDYCGFDFEPAEVITTSRLDPRRGGRILTTRARAQHAPFVAPSYSCQIHG